MMHLFRHAADMFSKDLEESDPLSMETRGRIDDGAREILEILNEAGFEAYVVGGCVRDLFLGRNPHDWDITTSAHPDEIVSVMDKEHIKTIDGNGRRFGTVIVVLNHTNYEVTTFRSEMYGEDSHRPSEVSFVGTLKEDLERRDFTVNAMALDADGILYDYFEGLKDIDRKRLRTVGDAAERFREDALRLFRACRFLGQLDFMADKSLVEGMPEAFDRVEGLSLERVKSEVNRLLITPHASRGLDLMVRSGLTDTSCRQKHNGEYTLIPVLPELHHLVNLPQMKEFHKYDGWMHTLAVVDASPKDLTTRWAALLHDVGKGMPGVRKVEGNRITDHGHDHKGAEMAEAILKRWQMPEDMIRHVVWLVREHMRFHYFANNSEADARKWVRAMARNHVFPTQKDCIHALREMTDLSKADVIGCGNPKADTSGHEAFGEYMMDLAAEMPFTTKDLHYTPEVIKVLGPYVAEGMQNLLLRVQSGNLNNNEHAILDAAVRYRRRKDV